MCESGRVENTRSRDLYVVDGVLVESEFTARSRRVSELTATYFSRQGHKEISGNAHTELIARNRTYNIGPASLERKSSELIICDCSIDIFKHSIIRDTHCINIKTLVEDILGLINLLSNGAFKN